MNNTILEYFKDRPNEWITPQKVADNTNMGVGFVNDCIHDLVKAGDLLWSIFEGTYQWNKNT